MKIVLSVEALSPNLTGIGRYTYELMNRLPFVLGKESVKFYRNKCWVDDPSSLIKENSLACSTKRNKYFKIKESLKQLTSNFSCRNYLHHAPNYFLPEIAETGVITIHDLSVFKYAETHPKERVIQFERLFNKSIRKASRIITDSVSTKNEVIEYLGWNPNNVIAVNLGVNTDFRPREQVDINVILQHYNLRAGEYTLCVSTIEPRKMIRSLLIAYKSLPPSMVRRYPLVLIGGFGWLSEDLHSEITELSQKSIVKYLGFVAENHLPYLYSGAKAFYYPSIYEGFGLPVLEAMSSGVPVACSDRTSLPEVTQGAALLFNPDSIECIRNSIIRTLVDEDWREDAIERGKITASKFTWERCIMETSKVYSTAQ